MARYFNVAGPCIEADHYMIEASSRLKGIIDLIDQKQYYVIHAARQSGKTTLLLDMTEQINAAGKYYALYCSLEMGQGIIDPGKGIPTIVNKIKIELKHSDIPGGKDFAAGKDLSDYANVLRDALIDFCTSLDKPLVIFFDEADCLGEGTMISFLRQLRDGHNTRGRIPFAHSIALVGLRNIRDFKVKIRPESVSLGGASPFNVITKAVTLRNFTKEEITELYGQHTRETGQPFDPEAIELVWRQTQGQPWLVNAVAREVIVEMLQSDYTLPVTAPLVTQAIQTIILRRDTHIDSLLERLKEERVRKVIEPLITGDLQSVDKQSDDYFYVRDLGLIRDIPGGFEPANPIYAEVIVRTLSYNTQDALADNSYPYRMPRYLKENGIDMTCLLEDFQSFWRENSEIWIERYEYKEAAPHLILQAFLQRVVNGGGAITREMAAGRNRLDLCIEFEGRKYPIELKLRRNEKTESDGLRQLAGYMDTLGCDKGWLIIFDRRPDVKWDDKIYLKTETGDGKIITVAGC